MLHMPRFGHEDLSTPGENGRVSPYTGQSHVEPLTKKVRPALGLFPSPPYKFSEHHTIPPPPTPQRVFYMSFSFPGPSHDKATLQHASTHSTQSRQAVTNKFTTHSIHRNAKHLGRARPATATAARLTAHHLHLPTQQQRKQQRQQQQQYQRHHRQAPRPGPPRPAPAPRPQGRVRAAARGGHRGDARAHRGR